MVNFNDLQLNTAIKDKVKTFDFNNQKVQVKQYLPTRDKYDLVMITLQKAKEDGLYNPLKIDMYFHLHLVYMYTDIQFTDEDREVEEVLYDKLVQSGFMNVFLANMDDDEYNTLNVYINSLVKDNMKYRNSAAAVLQSLITDLPKNAEAARQIVDNFNPEKYQEVIKFAEAANGNRPIGRRALAADALEGDGK